MRNSLWHKALLYSTITYFIKFMNMKTNPTPCVSIKKRLINSAFTKVFTSTTTSSRSFVRNSLIPLLFLLLILPCQAQNQQTTNTTKLYRIAGQIVSETDGAPIPYASITIAFFTDPDTPIQAFATDDKDALKHKSSRETT